MGNRTCERAEHKIDEAVAGKRGPVVVSDWLAVVNRERAALPGWLVQAVAQAQATAGPRRLGSDGRG